MENRTVSQRDKDKFLAASTFFLKEFEEKFVNYFTDVYVSNDKISTKEDAREIALDIYQGIFKCDADILTLKEDLLIRMRHNDLLIGFLTNRSMFYLIKEYIAYAKEHDMALQTELFIDCISQFLNLFENQITPKVSNFTKPLDVASFSDDVMFSPTNTIIEAFQHIKEENQSVMLLNLYKGVPISSEAAVLDIEGDNVTFKIDQLQEIAMKLDGQAFIVKNNYFSKHLKADIVYTNFQANTIVLTNFMYLLNMPALQREFIRVHPDIIAKVFLHQFGNLQTSGRLYDLSMNGLGVVSSENNGMFVGAKVLIEFELNSASVVKEGDRTIEVQGEVINIIEYQDSYRYCMRIFPDHTMSDKILHYITLREYEILEDLNNELKEYME